MSEHTKGPWFELETESSVDFPDLTGWQDIGPEGGKPVAWVDWVGLHRPDASETSR